MSEGITEGPARSGKWPAEIRYEVDVEDHVALRLYLFHHGARLPALPFVSGLLFVAAVGVALLAGAGLSVSYYPPSIFTSLRGYFIGVCILAAVAIVLILVDFGGVLHRLDLNRLTRHVRALQLQRVAQGDLRALVRAVVRLDDVGFTEVTTWDAGEPGFRQEERKETFAAWWLVNHVGVTEDHIFVQVRGKGFLIVPRDAFADEAGLRAFLDAVDGYRKAAHPQGISPERGRGD
jgi:hypothetical protein